MDLTKFLADLNDYEFIHGGETVKEMIKEVENIIEEIKDDHLQGDVDDQDK